jgi:hypothetical protein
MTENVSEQIFFSLALQLPAWALASAFQFHDYFTDRRTSWTSVYAFFCVVLCLGSGLATGQSLVQGVLPSVK